MDAVGSSTSSVGSTLSLDAMKKSMDVQQTQMQELLQGMTKNDQSAQEAAQKQPSQIAAQATGLGLGINVQA